MRKDILERMKLMKKENIKPNYAELSRQYNCVYRTVKKYFENNNIENIKEPKPSILDEYKPIIDEKLLIPCTYKSIFHFIKNKGYKGSYSVVKRYCRKVNLEKVNKATIRFETTPGLQAQVDWKENMKLVSRLGEIFNIQIFLMVLGYSRLKYFELTLDKTQDTLERCMINGLDYFGGTPKEILFDNMRTVVDHSRSNYQKAVINNKFYEFSKDVGFEIITARAYRPQTKGKVESLAKLMGRLKPYNREFNTLKELEIIVNNFRDSINLEVVQTTGESPYDRHKKEKEYLHPINKQALINNLFTLPIERIVTKDSMFTYLNNKYSLDPKYIGKTVILKVNRTKIDVFFSNMKISEHDISNNKFNYKKVDMVSILKSDVFKYKTDEELLDYADHNLKMYDKL